MRDELVRQIAVAAFATIGVFGATATCRAQDAVITVDQTTQHQTIVGWECVAQAGVWDDTYQIANHHKWLDTVIAGVVDDVGINRLRLELYSGYENPVDYWTPYWEGNATRQSWRDKRTEIINDNNDEMSIDPSGFQFAQLDKDIDTIVVPMRDRLATRGETLYVSLCYVDFVSRPNFHADNPDEYAEYILATFQHMDTKYGFVPDAVEVILEADLAPGWLSPTRVANAIVATGQRLAANQYTPDFIGPSNTNAERAVSYFDTMIGVTGVTQYLKELSYHRYGGATQSVIQSIGQRAVNNGVRTSMLEYWTNSLSSHTLHEDLKIANNSSWEGGTIAYTGSPGGTRTYYVDKSDPDNPTVGLEHLSKYLRQYFKFIRRDAVRVDASTTDADFDPVAFVNADGREVVVVDAAQGGTFAIDGLAPGTYGIKYTTGNGRAAPSAYDVDHPDQVLSTGGRLTTSIPAAGVITIYQKAVVDEDPVIVISSPTTQPTYNTQTASVDLQGTAADDDAVTTVTWTNDRGGAGTAVGTTSWSISGIPLQVGENLLTVTATDTGANTSSDTLRVILTLPDPGPPVIDPEDDPMEFDVSATADETCRRRLSWTLVDSKKATTVRKGLKRGQLAYTPTPKRWLKILRLGAEGGVLHAVVSCRGNNGNAEVEVARFLVEPPVDPAALSPPPGAELPTDTTPEFAYDPGPGRKTWIEFSATPGFERIAMRARTKAVPYELSKRRWRALRKRLERAGAGGTGFWRIRTTDVLKREALSTERAFDYEAP